MLRIKSGLKLSLISLSLSLFSHSVSAEEEKRFAADSEIYLFNLKAQDSKYQLSNGRNISNNPDYDSQPYFTPSNQTILFASSRDGEQTDIYEYDIKANQLNQVTDTEHSEFSPKPVANTGNVTFVSEGFNPYQTVRELNRKTGEHNWLLNTKEPVGYYQYEPTSGDVLIWSRYGWSIQYLNLKDNQNRFVTGHALPSTPQKIPNSDRFSFVHRQTNGMMWIKAFDPQDLSITPIAPIFDDNHDYTWTPNGDILRFQEGTLTVWPKGNKGFSWTVLQDVSQLVKGKLGRLAVSDNGQYLALVATK